MQPQNKILKDFKRFYRLMDDKVFVAFDTETSTLTPSTGRIIEIGAVKFSREGVLSSWSSLFNPEAEISPFVTELTHITNEMLINSPLISQKLNGFLDFIQDSILIAHNAQFDLNFLNFECEKCGLNKPRNKVIDTLQFARWAYPELGKYKISSLVEHFNIQNVQNHRATDDARACMEIFLQIIRDTKKN